MSATRLLGRTTLAAATMLGTVLVPATATAAPPQLSVLHLTVSKGYDVAASRASLLMCEPAGGTHPHATKACKSLNKVNGDFHSVGTENAMCPLIYDPVTAHATGTWRGKQVNYTKEFANRCVMESQTSGIFTF